MGISFEVRETDLLGRVGRLAVGGKVLETPYMFPVIHPVNQLVPPSELREMGFGGLMTNSYIIHSRRKQEALEKGLHRMLGFDGVFMTDSGGYQVLEYGDLEIGYRDVASFQSRIGSDLAVTLDRPTGYPQTRGRALETVEYSLGNAEATLKEFGGEKTQWVGPIQGGLYQDLVRRSAEGMVAAGFEFLALGSPVQVMESYMFADLVEMIAAAKRAIPYSVPLHLFGAGHPLTMSLAVALGCDTFDSASYAIFARTGRYMGRGGVMALQTMKYLPCSCQVCARTSVKELLELEHAERTRRLSVHNLWVLREELEACKEGMAEGRLWDLVEERSMAHPRLRAAFARLAAHSKELEPGTRPFKDRGLFVRSTLDLLRPELAMAAERLAGVMRRGSGTAVLVPEGGRGRPGVRGDEYRIHPMLGPYPAGLRFQYPFSQTEASVEGRWSVAEAAKKLRGMGYARVVVVGGDGADPGKARRSRRRRTRHKGSSRKGAGGRGRSASRTEKA